MLDSNPNGMLVFNFFDLSFWRNRMASKDGKIFDTIVLIGLGVNGITAIYLLLMYFEII